MGMRKKGVKTLEESNYFDSKRGELVC